MSSSSTESINSPKHENDKSFKVILNDLSISPPMKMITKPTILTTAETMPDTVPDDINPIIQATIPETTTPFNTNIDTEILSETAVPIDVIPTIKVTRETLLANSLLNNDITPKMVSTDSTSVYDTDSEMKSIFHHFSNPLLHSVRMNDEKSSSRGQITNSLLRPIISLATSTMMISSSQTIDTDETKTSGRRPYLKVIPKIHQQQNDELNVEPNYIQLKANSTSPIITYSQSIPKARLDQWKWEIKEKEHYQQQQQQQTTNSNWISDNDDNNHDNIVSNSNRILSLSIFSTLSFSLLFLLLFLFF